MIHLAIDHGKKNSHAVAMTDDGTICYDERIPTTYEALASIKEALPEGEPVHSTIEASWNWGKVFDALEELGLNPQLANPTKSRLVAESFTKTDRNDAMTHAFMLRKGITPLVHVPSKEIRDHKNILRHRFWLIRVQTMIKNRIHSIIDRNHQTPPKLTDLFGSTGRAWVNGLRLREPDGKLLKSHLKLLDFIRSQAKETEKQVREVMKENPSVAILRSLPGVGPMMSALIALEVDTIDRFHSPGKFAAYCGLVPSTYSSGEKIAHGRMISRANRHLRYAFIESGWNAIRVSPYFSALYRRLKDRKGAGKAIGAVGRRLSEIAYACLKNERLYEERPYRFRSYEERFGRAALISG